MPLIEFEPGIFADEADGTDDCIPSLTGVANGPLSADGDHTPPSVPSTLAKGDLYADAQKRHGAARLGSQRVN
jgi:hypothetical protein